MTLKLGDFLDYLLVRLSSIAHSIGEDTTRQFQQVVEFLNNIYELNFLEITLFQYFIISIILMITLSNILWGIGEILINSWVRALYYIYSVLTFIFSFYLLWLVLKFSLGGLINLLTLWIHPIKLLLYYYFITFWSGRLRTIIPSGHWTFESFGFCEMSKYSIFVL